MHLTTPRLILRKFTADDFVRFADLMANPEVMRFSLNGPMDESTARECFQSRVIDHYAQFGYGPYAVVDRSDNQIIGFAGLLNQNIDNESRTELAYRFHPDYWGKGFATEAALAVCHYAFTQLDMQELISIIDPENVRSAELAKRIGMYFWKESTFHGFKVGIYALKKIRVVPYMESWSLEFEKEKKALQSCLKGLDISFHHIGSTAIERCSAKPIIDILGVISDVTLVDQYADSLAKLGYQAMGEFGMKQRRYFRRKNQNPVHLHIFEDTDPETERHLRFVAFLNSNSRLVDEYSAIKENLAAQFPENIEKYCLGKDEFIKRMDLIAVSSSNHYLLPKKVVQRKSQWSQDEILKAMIANMHLHMTYFARYINTANLLLLPDVSVVYSKIKDDTFNYVLCAGFKASNAIERVSTILKLFENLSVPFAWWLGPTDSPKNLSQILLERGLSFKENNSGMYLPMENYREVQIQADLIFQKADSLPSLKQFCEVLISVGVSSQIFDQLYERIPPLLYQEGSSFEMYVASLDGIPVTTGILVHHANVGGIYYVATKPQYRNKGFGTSMMHYLIQKAKDKGFKMVTLQASQKGKKLYLELGFKEFCLFEEYGKV